MNIDKMREEFEAEFRKNPKFEGNTIHADAMLERGSNGEYRSTIAFGAWWGWRASRESLVFNTGELADENTCPISVESYWIKQIEAAGMKVNP